MRLRTTAPPVRRDRAKATSTSSRRAAADGTTRTRTGPHRPERARRSSSNSARRCTGLITLRAGTGPSGAGLAGQPDPPWSPSDGGTRGGATDVGCSAGTSSSWSSSSPGLGPAPCTCTAPVPGSAPPGRSPTSLRLGGRRAATAPRRRLAELVREIGGVRAASGCGPARAPGDARPASGARAIRPQPAHRVGGTKGRTPPRPGSAPPCTGARRSAGRPSRAAHSWGRAGAAVA